MNGLFGKTGRDEGLGPVNLNVLTVFLAFLIGGLIPQAMRTAQWMRQAPRSVSFVFLAYIPLWGGRTVNEN
jgi:hypothetical protein